MSKPSINRWLDEMKKDNLSETEQAVVVRYTE
mgnify:CR=1 FL=1